MSDVAQGPGWWLASDGRWYPPESAPSAPGGTVPQPQWWSPQSVPPSAVSAGLANGLRITFWIVAGVSAVRLVADVVGWATFAAFSSEGGRAAYDRWQWAATAGGLWGIVQALSGLALLVLVIVWSWQAHRTVTSLAAPPHWRIGWTIGAWFTCCAAIVLPKLVLTDIERAAMGPRRDGRVMAMWHARPTLAVGWVWWVALVLSYFRFDASSPSTGDGLRDALLNEGALNAAYAIGLVTAGLAVVAAIAGGTYFGRMSERLTPEGLAAHRDD